MFFSNKFISYVASYVGHIQTGFLRGFRKSSGHRNRKHRNPEDLQELPTETVVTFAVIITSTLIAAICFAVAFSLLRCPLVAFFCARPSFR